MPANENVLLDLRSFAGCNEIVGQVILPVSRLACLPLHGTCSPGRKPRLAAPSVPGWARALTVRRAPRRS